MTKRQFTPQFKAKIVLEILREEKSISEIGSREEIAVSQLHGWKKEFLENAVRVFSQTKIEKEAKLNARELADGEQALMAKVGQLTIITFFKDIIFTHKVIISTINIPKQLPGDFEYTAL